MKDLRSKSHDDDDIDLEEIFFAPFLAVILIVIVFLIVLGLAALVAVDDNGVAKRHNETAAEFNALTLAERRVIAGWLKDESIDSETWLMQEKDAEIPLFLPARICRATGISGGKFSLIMIGSVLWALSLVTFIAYIREKYSQYYLCSLPFYKPYGWILFFCMFAGWPVMFVSFLDLLCDWICRICGQEGKQRRTAKKREKAAVKKLAEEELEARAKEMTRPIFTKKAEKTFCDFVTKKFPKAHAARLKAAEKEVEAAKERLQWAGDGVRDAQRRLGEAKAELDRLEATYSKQHSGEIARRDWEIIKNARGVSRIVYNQVLKRLEITIKVRVPYEGELYDFGDYVFYLDGTTKCVCHEIRSGVKLNHISTAPLYHIENNNFCFGNSFSTISNYLKDGRYVEAITLVIECMHSTNNDYDATQIPNCFRKVSVVEKAKRKILLCNKLKFWERM